MGRSQGEACRETIKDFIELSVERLTAFAGSNRHADTSAEQSVSRSAHRGTGAEGGGGEGAGRNEGREGRSGLTRKGLMEKAMSYLPYVQRFDPSMVEEMQGIAEGAGLPFEDVLFLQVRTHLMRPPDGGCTAFAVEESAAKKGIPLAGQNWDWDPDLDGVCLILKRYPENKPSFMCFTQPGLIAYIGLSSEGIAACLNLLLAPGYSYGVPTYCILRSLFEQRDMEGCREAVERARIAMSQNILVLTPQGALDFEIAVKGTSVLRSSDSGVLTHTNHFLDPRLAAEDELVDELPDTKARYSRINELIARLDGKSDAEALKRILEDHDGYPRSICRHRSEDPKYGYMGTVCSIILEPTERRMHISRGNPCEHGFQTYRLGSSR